MICLSCEQVINIDFPDDGRKMVLNSLFNTDSTLTINLSRSEHILSTSNNFEPVTNATVWLYENDQQIETGTQIYEGLYHFNSVMERGKTYSINVTAEGLPDISCKTIVPTPIIIDTVKMNLRLVNEGYGPNIEQIDFNLQFKDNPSEQNYYLLTAYYNQIVGYSIDVNLDTTYISNKNPLHLSTLIPSNNVNTGNMVMTSIIFDDATFNGELYNLQFFTDNFHFYNYFNQNPETTIYFRLSIISKDLYLYYQSYNKYQEIQGVPLAEPVKVYSNIKNGFGIFAGSAIAIDSVKFNMDDVFN
jgi:hypothetical protein